MSREGICANSTIGRYSDTRWLNAMPAFVWAYHPFWLGLDTTALDLWTGYVRLRSASPGHPDTEACRAAAIGVR